MRNILFNPWITILFSPRKTFQYILSNWKGYFISFQSFLFLTFLLTLRHPKVHVGFSVKGNLILNSVQLLGLLCILFIFCLFLFCVGKILRGKASLISIFYCVSAACMPFLLILMLWIIELILFVNGKDIYNPNLFLLLNFITLIWALVIITGCISTVQHFTIWKALINIIIGTLLFCLFFSFGVDMMEKYIEPIQIPKGY
ncbi:YIP1 family protein [Schinkia sp. CFF1]